MSRAAPSLVVDTSAVFAILIGEPAGDWLMATLESAPRRLMSAATVLEAGIVLESRVGVAGTGVAHRFLCESQVTVVPVDENHCERALEGWRRFGKGRHPAGLNFGDCFVYALAVTTGLPVLCTGDDFAETDIPVFRPPPRVGA